MFGYIRPYKPEMRVWEFEVYQAVYCGLCRQLGHAFGPLARLTLSYDFVFMALLDLALHGEKPQIRPGRCPFNPLVKRPYLTGGAALERAAAAAMVLLYYQALDHRKDERGAAKWMWSAALPFLRTMAKRGEQLMPGVDQAAARLLAEQAQVEAGPASLDAACEPTGTCMRQLVCLLAPEGQPGRALERMSYFLGKSIYLFDCLDDWEEDQRRGRYNPLVAGQWQREEAQQAARMAVAEAAGAFYLVDFPQQQPILENIVCRGLLAVLEEIVQKRKGGSGCEGSLSGAGREPTGE